MTTHAHAGNPGSPYGGRKPGQPHESDPHADHDVATLTSERHRGGPVGRRICLACDVVLEVLTLCGRATKRGRPCRVPVRPDLGFTACASHGEGRGAPARRDGGPADMSGSAVTGIG